MLASMDGDFVVFFHQPFVAAGFAHPVERQRDAYHDQADQACEQAGVQLFGFQHIV